MRTGQNIYKRRDGRWEARVPLGKKADGRPYFKYLYASACPAGEKGGWPSIF